MDEETVDSITSRSATDTGSESDGSDVVFVGISSAGVTDADPNTIVKHKVEDSCASHSATDTESESDSSNVVFVRISSTGATAKDRPSVLKHKVEDSRASHSSNGQLSDAVAISDRDSDNDISGVMYGKKCYITSSYHTVFISYADG